MKNTSLLVALCGVFFLERAVAQTPKADTDKQQLFQSFSVLENDATKIRDKSLREWQGFGDSLVKKAESLITADEKRALQKGVSDCAAKLTSVADMFLKRQSRALDSAKKAFQSQPFSKIKEPAAEFLESEQELLDTFKSELSDMSDVFSDSLYDVAEAMLLAKTEDIDPALLNAEKSNAIAASLADEIPDDAPFPQWSISTTYQGRAYWRGIDQNDQNASSYTDITYTHPIGLYASVGVTGLFGQSNFFDQLTLSAGYQKAIAEKLTVVLSYSRYFYDQNSVQVRSAYTDNLGATVSYITPIVTPSISFNYLFASGGGDAFLSFLLTRSFFIDDVLGGTISIDPSASLDFGTLQSITQRATVIQQRNQPPRVQPTARIDSRFVITNYNLSLGVSYLVGIFAFTPELSLTVPVNVSTVTIVNPLRPSQTRTERVETPPAFFLTISASVMF